MDDDDDGDDDDHDHDGWMDGWLMADVGVMA